MMMWSNFHCDVAELTILGGFKSTISYFNGLSIFLNLNLGSLVSESFQLKFNEL